MGVSGACLDENPKEGKYYELTNVSQGKYCKIRVGHTKFQST